MPRDSGMVWLAGLASCAFVLVVLGGSADRVQPWRMSAAVFASLGLLVLAGFQLQHM